MSKKYKNNDFRFPKKSLKKVFRMSKKRPQKHDSARWKLCGLGEYLLMSIADNEPIRKSASKQIRLNCVRDLFGNWLETFWKLVGDLLGTLKLSKNCLETWWTRFGNFFGTCLETSRGLQETLRNCWIRRTNPKDCWSTFGCSQFSKRVFKECLTSF